MKVILIKEVAGTGHKGDIKEVADGFAVNFLIPHKLAWPATSRNLSSVTFQEQVAVKRAIRQAVSARDMAKKLKGYKLVIKAKADETGKLYGSITNVKIAEALDKAGFNISAGQVKLVEHLKKVGNFPIKIQLDPSSDAQIVLSVGKE